MISQVNFSDTYGRNVGGRILVPLRDKIETYAMRTRFGLKKFQRGILQLAAGGTMVSGGGGGVVPFVSNIVIASTVSSGIVNAGIVFNYTTGGFGNHQLIKRNNAVFTLMGNDDAGAPVDHTGEWTASAQFATNWEFSCLSMAVGAWDFQFVGVGFYTNFSTADMTWRENRTGGKGYTPGTDTATGNFRIREVADTGNFTDFTVQATATQT